MATLEARAERAALRVEVFTRRLEQATAERDGIVLEAVAAGRSLAAAARLVHVSKARAAQIVRKATG